MRKLLLIILYSIILIITSCDNQTDKLKAERDAELKELILGMKGDVKEGDRYSYPEWRVADINAYELIPELITFLSDKNSRTRISAARALCELGAKETIPEIIKLLEDDKSFVREEAVEILGRFRAKESIPELLSLLEKEGKDPRKNVWSLGGIATVLSKLDAKESIPILLELTKNKDIDDLGRPRIIFALTRLDVKEVIPEVISLYPGTDESEHEVFLTKISPKEFILKLMEFLKNKSTLRYVVNDLYKLNAKEVIPELIGLLQNEDIEDIDIRKSVIRLLGKFKAKESIPNLIELLHKDNNKEVHTETVFALGRLGVKEAIPELINIIKDEKYLEYHLELFGEASDMLADLNAKESIPELMNQMKNAKYICCRPEAAFALVRLGNKEVIPELIRLTKIRLTTRLTEIEDGSIDTAYILKLADIGIRESIPELLKLLKSNGRYGRVFAAIALVKLNEKQHITEDIIRDMQNTLYAADTLLYNPIRERVKETLMILGKQVD